MIWGLARDVLDKPSAMHIDPALHSLRQRVQQVWLGLGCSWSRKYPMLTTQWVSPSATCLNSENKQTPIRYLPTSSGECCWIQVLATWIKHASTKYKCRESSQITSAYLSGIASAAAKAIEKWEWQSQFGSEPFSGGRNPSLHLVP